MRRSQGLSLAGPWRFRPDPERIGEHFRAQLDIPWGDDARWMEPGYDDSGWSTIAVPSCWQAEGHAYNGVAWYRRAVPAPQAAYAQPRYWLRFGGVDYFADTWFNGRYLGSHEGYFAAHQYEITDLIHEGDNLLAVRVDSPNDICAKERQVGQLKTLLKGALQRWDVNNPQINPGGIWEEVTLLATGAAAIDHLRVETSIRQLPPHEDLGREVPASAHVAIRVAGLRGEPAQAEAAVSIRFRGDLVKEVRLPLPAVSGLWTTTVSLELDAVHLWFPRDLGEPCFYEVEVVLRVDGHVSDRAVLPFGFRAIERRAGWETYLNGVRLFQRGANYLSDQLLSTMTPERYQVDLDRLVEAHLNTVHPFAVVERQDFYDQCDRRGLLVYQDFPMWLAMDNGGDLVRRATLQLRELIDQFGHHPSILVWNFGSQPSVANFLKLGAALTRAARELDPARIAHQANALLATGAEAPDPVNDFRWDLDTLRSFRDGHDWRTDTHNYRGWYEGDLSSVRATPLELIDLVSEYGAQALPSVRAVQEMIEPAGLFPPDRVKYARRLLQPEYQFRVIEPPATLEQFVADSQAYQARFIQSHTEFYRLHQFSPCNGAHYFCFNDCWPAITWSVVDYHRERKLGYFALQRAMAPLQVFLDLDWESGPLASLDAPLWVVNDLPRPYSELVVTWEVCKPDGARMAYGEAQGEVPALDKAQLGRLAWEPALGGRARITLALSQRGVTLAENEYKVEFAERRAASSR